MSSALPTPLTGADLAACEALETGTVVFTHLNARHLEFAGAKAAETLTGLVTNDVLALAPGQGQYAAALTAKGRVVADLRILRLDDDRLLTTTGEASWPGWRDLVRKFVNPRFAKYTDRAFHTVSLHGPGARVTAAEMLGTLTGVTDVPDTGWYACRTYRVGDEELIAVTSPALGDIPGLDLLVPESLADPLRAALAGTDGLTAGTVLAWETARIEAGRPQWGRDMDDTTIPQEANLGEWGALSFDKGCYTGQETVARIHFRGHVNRHLRVLSSPVPLAAGAEVRAEDGKVVGDVRSTAISPKTGPVAIAMVRRELPVDNMVRVAWTDDDAESETQTEARILR